MIEKLTDEERLEVKGIQGTGSKVVRIVDQQSERINKMRAALLECQEECSEWPVRAGLRRRIAEALGES